MSNRSAYISKFGYEDKSIDNLLADLGQSDVGVRIRAIISFSFKRDLPLQAFITVASHVDDHGKIDDPRDITFPMIAKWVPMVSVCCETFLPEIAIKSPNTIHTAIREYWELEKDNRMVIRKALRIIGETTLAETLGYADKNWRSTSIRPLLETIFFEYWYTPPAPVGLQISGREHPTLLASLNFLSTEQFAKAATTLNELTDTCPTEPFYWGLLAKAMEGSGFIEKALLIWNQICQMPQIEPFICKWANDEVDRLEEMQRKIGQTINDEDLISKDTKKLQSLLESYPSEILSKAVTSKKVYDRLKAALYHCSPNRLESWMELFPNSQDKRWKVLYNITSSKHRSSLRISIVLSAISLIFLILSEASVIWRIGIEGTNDVINGWFLLFFVFAGGISIGGWEASNKWDKLFSIVSSKDSNIVLTNHVRIARILYPVTLVATVILAICVAYLMKTS